MKTITLPISNEISKDIEEIAQEDRRTPNEVILEAIREYRARRLLKSIAKEGQALAKEMKLTPEDFGGPFED